MREFMRLLADDPALATALFTLVSAVLSFAFAILRRVAPNVGSAIASLIPFPDFALAVQQLAAALRAREERRRASDPKLPSPPPLPNLDDDDRPTPTPVDPRSATERAPIRPKTWRN